MFKSLAEFRRGGLRYVAQVPNYVMNSDDNLPGFRRAAAAGKRRSPTPGLACHWFDRDGRLECGWQTETNDTPTGDFDEHEHSTTGRTSGRSLSMQPCGRALALAG